MNLFYIFLNPEDWHTFSNAVNTALNMVAPDSFADIWKHPTDNKWAYPKMPIIDGLVAGGHITAPEGLEIIQIDRDAAPDWYNDD